MSKCPRESKCFVCWPEFRPEFPTAEIPKAPPPAPLAHPYDFNAQLRVVCEESGQPIPNIPYSLVLSDGSRPTGTTDANGLTAVISTPRQVDILTLTVTPANKGGGNVCCHAPENWWQDERLYVGANGRALTSTIKTDTQTVTTVPLPKGEARGLTRGEERMARMVFGDSINYGKVKINNRGSGWALGFQDPNRAMTPNGQMYFPPPIYRDDFSEAPDVDKRRFIHEMVHVWQLQMGYGVKRHGAMLQMAGSSSYEYTITPTSKLSDFNMEQQGDLISDYYMICIYRHAASAYNPHTNPIDLYRVMTPFANPVDPSHLPR